MPYRELTKKVIAHEKYGFWSDWTKEQQHDYTSGDWEKFSRSRGYTEEEIADFREWLKMYYKYGDSNIKDLVVNAACDNVLKDKKGEILLSSYIPKTKGA